MDSLLRRRRRANGAAAAAAEDNGASSGAYAFSGSRRRRERSSGEAGGTSWLSSRHHEYISRSSRLEDWWGILTAPRNLATGLYALSYTVSLPVLPFMARKQIYGEGAHAAVPEAWRGLAYGLVMSGYYATKMVSAPLIGFMSDRWGRRQALMLTFAGCSASFFLTMALGQHSIMGLILCRLLMGCFAANGALIHAYIRDTVPTEWQASAFAQHSAAWGLAYAATSPILAAFKEKATPCLALAAICMFFAALLVWMAFEETHPNGPRDRRQSSAVDSMLNGGSYAATDANPSAAAAAPAAVPEAAAAAHAAVPVIVDAEPLRAVEPLPAAAAEAAAETMARQQALTIALNHIVPVAAEQLRAAEQLHMVEQFHVAEQLRAGGKAVPSKRALEDPAESANLGCASTEGSNGVCWPGAGSATAAGGSNGLLNGDRVARGSNGSDAASEGYNEGAELLEVLSSSGSSSGKLRCESDDHTEGPTPDSEMWPNNLSSHHSRDRLATTSVWEAQALSPIGVDALPVGHRVCTCSPPGRRPSEDHALCNAAVHWDVVMSDSEADEAVARGNSGAEMVLPPPTVSSSAPAGRQRAATESWAPMMEVFWAMLGERLIASAFLLQVLRPAQDMAPLLESRFGKGAGAVAGLSSVRALCRVLVPLTPIIPLLSRMLGGGNVASGGGGRRGKNTRVGVADRRVAAFMCVIMALLAALLPSAQSLPMLHLLAGFKGLCYVIRESTVNAAMARVASSANVGAFFGWQHFMKGMAGVSSNLMAGWLCTYNLEALYYFTSLIDLVYAATYIYA